MKKTSEEAEAPRMGTALPEPAITATTSAALEAAKLEAQSKPTEEAPTRAVALTAKVCSYHVDARQQDMDCSFRIA